MTVSLCELARIERCRPRAPKKGPMHLQTSCEQLCEAAGAVPEALSGGIRRRSSLSQIRHLKCTETSSELRRSEFRGANTGTCYGHQTKLQHASVGRLTTLGRRNPTDPRNRNYNNLHVGLVRPASPRLIASPRTCGTADATSPGIIANERRLYPLLEHLCGPVPARTCTCCGA